MPKELHRIKPSGVPSGFDSPLSRVPIWQTSLPIQRRGRPPSCFFGRAMRDRFVAEALFQTC